MRFWVGVFAIAVWAPLGMWAQTSVQAGPEVAPQAQPAVLSIPFGVVNGKLVTSGDYVIFIDDEQPGSSFALSRDDVANATVDNGMLVLDLRKAVRNRGGETKRLNLRTTDPAAAASFVSWAKAAGQAGPQPSAAPRTDEPQAGRPAGVTQAGAPAPAGSAPAQTLGPGALTYQARHKHRIGSCTGRLILGPDRIAYESITAIGDSRQWDLKDIKELKRDNPYSLKIVPFTGNDYSLDLIGNGMDNAEYKVLVDRITAVRVARQ
jgi:hypothetical protein